MSIVLRIMSLIQRLDKRHGDLAPLILFMAGLLLGGLMAYLTIVWAAGNPGLNSGGGGATPIPDRITIGEEAPDFVSHTPDGQEVRLADFRGHPVAVNFWATWCAPCRIEMPLLQSSVEKYQRVGFAVIGVNAGESADTIQAFLDEQHLNLIIALDLDGKIVNAYDIRAFPTTIWIDRLGIVRAKHLGPLTEEYVARYVADLSSR